MAIQAIGACSECRERTRLQFVYDCEVQNARTYAWMHVGVYARDDKEVYECERIVIQVAYEGWADISRRLPRELGSYHRLKIQPWSSLTRLQTRV